MLMFVLFCLIAFMIFTLVRNALAGIQLSSSDSYDGDIELIIPICSGSEFYIDPWMNSLHNFRSLQANNLRIHILIDGHHPAMAAWEELHQKLPFVELHSYSLRPLGREAIPWMINQISAQIRASVVIIGDAELVATEGAFLSVAHHVCANAKPLFYPPSNGPAQPFGRISGRIKSYPGPRLSLWL
jgi:hypothetical protein